MTNPGPAPVSFSVEHVNLAECGFNVELDRVKQLPGAPDHEPIDFVVSFDPRGANLSLGEVQITVPINVSGNLDHFKHCFKYNYQFHSHGFLH